MWESDSFSRQTVNDEVKTIHQSIRTITPIIDLVGGRLATIVKRLTCCFCGSRLWSPIGLCSLLYILLFPLTILLTRLRYESEEHLSNHPRRASGWSRNHCWHFFIVARCTIVKLHKIKFGKLFCRFTKQSKWQNYLSFRNVDMTIKMIHIWLVTLLLCGGSYDQKFVWTNIDIRLVGLGLFDSTKSELLLLRCCV